jgi:uncharacterized protein (DUF433 family)
MVPNSCLDDPRYRPLYTLTEVSRYARVLPGTLRSWSEVEGRPLVAMADPESRSPFSFVNLIEAHVLVALRRIHRVRMSQIRSATDWLSREYGTSHPLAEVDLETDGREIFIRDLGMPVSASARGQGTFQQIIDLYLQRIERDESCIPTRFFPFTYDACPKTIVMDPAVAFGRPVITGTRVATTMVFDRYSGGESLTDIAADYDLELLAVEEALRCEIERHRAA